MNRQQRLFYRVFSHIVLRSTLGVGMGVVSRGLENIPKRGAFLLVGNHRSWMDPLIMAMEIDRTVNFLAASFNFHIPIAGWAFKNSGVMPLHLEGGGKNEPTFRKCIQLLSKGEPVGIYPEGIQNFINPEGKKVKSFQTGFVRIALAAGKPVIPVALVPKKEYVLGKTNDPWFRRVMRFENVPKETIIDLSLVMYLGKIIVNVGKPIPLDDYYHQMHTKELLNHIAGKIRRAVANLYEEGQKEQEL